MWPCQTAYSAQTINGARSLVRQRIWHEQVMEHITIELISRQSPFVEEGWRGREIRELAPVRGRPSKIARVSDLSRAYPDLQ